MRVRNRPGAAEMLAAHPNFVISDPTLWKGKWNELFENDHPIHIEIGMGKGQFITGMAKAHPEINYIGVEMQVSVVSIALDKLIEQPLPNLKLLHVDGSALTEYFADSEVDQIYLNFSDPWPKKRHEKRRLTYKTFLAIDEQILRPNGEIHFKTDNQGLFEYSLASFSQYGMILKQVWLDLHQSQFEGNIMTEYEEKFSLKGQRIYRVEAQFQDKTKKKNLRN
ncbi:TPA: tRNA (guanosine(46)-N7)-methyltransferase TrmB [Enterococcus faecium]|uniref:tRNA (guanosine(46)-N7)-methyltransferase TrmB n=1 Tax=Enterococcus sp. E5-37 TaxID=2996024 RepID=UPI001A014D3D|nr:tRNA (guanosine(46)-N7)-methyltransferase TrmB [Enterococcus sp. E5-37]EGP4944442.1 tRNA (guanosine(46)-N7)-methyltransferase TrmB [Enterococcus faecium]EGP5309318.1 tRNA (guanosine(46)-N7)-methyltransferase TrmB [Enterococcus faecium]EME7161582.1 tRNA (guanosine(46)-N7)-methyltransferase TrmB [Enterococcus faecium]EME8211463.1 tRNA (guanosine(46)-N7)-methyltransferase TrmB [Enterococcus faecium]EME8219804.1 tRNA (guanosine(46)-N7)-methyltransferase TrmB [Enterococcus faecium]